MRHGYLMDMDLREGTLDIYLTSKLFCVKWKSCFLLDTTVAFSELRKGLGPSENNNEY
jgi:hypothetical protein